MNIGGYAKQRFPDLQGEMFDCIICLQVVRDPKQCQTCGNLLCASCINDWMKKNATCPNRCPGSSITPMSAKALINIYKDLNIKCQKCSKVMKLGDIDKHEDKCGIPQCAFFQFCSGFENKEISSSKPVCSKKCQVLQELLLSKGDKKKVYTILNNYTPRNENIGGSLNNISNSQKKILKWNNKQSGMNVVFTADNTSIYLKEENYVFRSVVSAQGFMEGCHYWEIVADGRTQNQLKIGVSANNIFDFNTAFCDHKFGFAFYGLAQLRHGSNATGPQYGKRFKKTGTLGVYLNMNKGSLTFSFNGENMGVAFTDPQLTKGPIYPAVALLHCAGCTIKGELPIPAIFQK